MLGNRVWPLLAASLALLSGPVLAGVDVKAYTRLDTFTSIKLSPTGEYLAGYAESSDGLHWVRKDDQLGMALSAEGWDSRHLCYPALIECEGRVFMFYNGNDMGREGFGCAELRAW